jgi:transposase
MIQKQSPPSGGFPTISGRSANHCCHLRSRPKRQVDRLSRFGRSLTGYCTCFEPVSSGRLFPLALGRARRVIGAFSSGATEASGPDSGKTSWNATTRRTGLAGTGSPPTVQRFLPPLGGDDTGPDPTNRGKLGTKRHILSDRRGAPLGAVISAANRNDMKVAEATLDSVMVTRPTPTDDQPQHLCRDKGFDFPETRRAAEERGYIVHTPVRGIDAPAPPPDQRFPARRWVLERTNSWHNRFRKLRIRYEKKVANYLGLVQFASFLIVYRLRLVLG